MSDIIRTSAAKILITSPEIINKAYEVHGLIIKYMPHVPQEGQRCIPLIALDIACRMNLCTEFSRSKFATSAVVPQCVYQRYLEAVLDVLETTGHFNITLEYVLKSVALSKYYFAAEKILQHLCDDTSPREPKASRTNIAIAAYLTFLCINKSCDFESLCLVAACSNKKTINSLLKTARTKCKELVKELKNDIPEHSIKPNQMQKSIPDAIFRAADPSLYYSNGKGIFSFCGLNSIKLHTSFC